MEVAVFLGPSHFLLPTGLSFDASCHWSTLYRFADSGERVFCPGRKATFFDRLLVYGQPMLRVLRISTVGGCPMSHQKDGSGFLWSCLSGRLKQSPRNFEG